MDGPPPFNETVFPNKEVIAYIGEGVKEHQVKEAMKSIDKAFIVEDPKERARRINDEFKL